MTHDELLAKLDLEAQVCDSCPTTKALRAVVELHEEVKYETFSVCNYCPAIVYPCPTIQAIEGSLNPTE